MKIKKEVMFPALLAAGFMGGLLLSYSVHSHGKDETKVFVSVPLEDNDRDEKKPPPPTIVAELGQGPSLPDISPQSVAHALNGILGQENLGQQDALLREYLALASSTEDYLLIYRAMQDWMSLHEGLMESGVYTSIYAAYETLADHLLHAKPSESIDGLIAYMAENPYGDSDGPELVDGLIASVFRKWLLTDFEQAFRYLDRNQMDINALGGYLGRDLANDLVKAWVKNSPEQTLEWISKQPEAEQPKLMKSAVASIYQDHPELASELLLNPNIADRAIMAEKLAWSWSSSNPEAVLAWSGELDGKSRAVAAASAMETWIENNSVAAFEGFNSLTGAVRDAASQTASHSFWTKEQDFSGAAEFLEKEPAGPGRNAGIRDLVANWSVEDPQEASRWLARMAGTDAALDEAVVELGVNLSEKHPGQAADWFCTLHDASQREAFLGNVLDRWYRTSPSDVLSWIDSSGRLNREERMALTDRYDFIPDS